MSQGGIDSNDIKALDESIINQAPSFPALDGSQLIRRRATFSKSIFNIESHHASNNRNRLVRHHDRRRYVDDYSLRLIDDLINRPVDPLFMDSRLNTQKVSPLSLWSTRVIVFIVCIAVGTIGTQFVRKLHVDSRKTIRMSLANELSGHTTKFNSLLKEVTKLHNSVDRESKRITTPEENQVTKNDDMTNGINPVEGPGIVITLANPFSAVSGSTEGNLPRESSGARMRVITDRDIQRLVSILWEGGAEAIAVNGHRLGVQTYIRTAGQSILIGVNQTQSPYTIEAIGDSGKLYKKISDQIHSSWYSSLTNAGINPQVSSSNVLKLSVASTGDIQFAQRRKIGE